MTLSLNWLGKRFFSKFDRCCAALADRCAGGTATTTHKKIILIPVGATFTPTNTMSKISMKLLRTLIGPLLATNACFVQAAEVDPFELVSRNVRLIGPEVSGLFKTAQGVRLNNDHILTAAHVVENLPSGSTLTVFNVVDQRKIGTATVLREGVKEVNDLALLAFTATNQFTRVLTPAHVCSGDTLPGELLVVAYENTFTKTHANMDDSFLTIAGDSPTYSKATQAFFSNGVSGAGVYSLEHSCLAGIISGYRPVCSDRGNTACGGHFGTEFTPASTIRQFLKSPAIHSTPAASSSATPQSSETTLALHKSM